MKKPISILIIVIFSVLPNSETFGAIGNYSIVLELTKSELSKVEKSKLKKLFKLKGKWRKHQERWFLVGILGLTGILATLKLTQIIAWSWLWVLAPIWITITLLVLIIIYVIILFLLIPPPPEVIPAE